MPQNSYAHQMPPSPPREYAFNHYGAYQPKALHASHNLLSVRHDKPMYDQSGYYAQAHQSYPSAATTYHPQPIQRPQQHNGPLHAGIASATHSFGPAVVAMPPVQPQHRLMSDENSGRRPQRKLEHRSRQEAKEDKPMGGVAAHLDYDMDQMTDYVADMSQRIVQPNGLVSPAFRKFVSQILSSTRLPSSTILLGLHYLSTRMSMLNQKGSQKASSGQLYRMLTIALLLGSKFLDDNTFQNRSWSEVTALPVAELNVLEREWLASINWHLHVEMDETSGFMSWKRHWEQWREGRVATRANAQRIGLAPLSTNVQRTHPQSAAVSPAAYYPSRYGSITPTYENDGQPSHYQASMQYDQLPWMYPSSSQNSPPSAPESGPTTPEYYGAPNTWTYHSGQQAYCANPLPQHRQPTQPAQPCSYQQGLYVQQYTTSSWNNNSHGFGCRCISCSRSNEVSHFAAHPGNQMVVG